MAKKSSKDISIENLEQTLQSLVAFCPSGCIVLNSDGTVSLVNDLASQATDIPTDKLLGVPFADLLVPEFGDYFTAILASDLEEAQTISVRLASGLKPIELRITAIADSTYVMSVRDLMTEHKLSAQAGADLTHDQLTGLPNQYHVLALLNERMNASNPKPLSLVCVWIDELPELTSSHGIKAVEKVIQEVGDRLTQKLRAPDMLGRFDEAGFLALLTSDAKEEELAEIADRLRNEIAFPVNFDKKLVSFTASVALATLGNKKPSVERILALMESSGTRAANDGGNRTDILKF